LVRSRGRLGIESGEGHERDSDVRGEKKRRKTGCGVPGFLPEMAVKMAWKSGSGRGPRESSACNRVWCRHDNGAMPPTPLAKPIFSNAAG
jgi:hypothetical protein